MTAERFYYDFEDPLGHKIIDIEKSINYPLETVGDFRKITDLLNEYADETILLKNELENEKKQKEEWAFISDCSVQVLNDEEKVKDEYLTVATNQLNDLTKENTELKNEVAHLRGAKSSWKITASEEMMRHAKTFEELVQVKQENEELRKHINDTEIAVEIETEKQMNNISEVIDKKIEEYNNIRETYKQENKNSLDDLKMVDASILTLHGLKKELGL